MIVSFSIEIWPALNGLDGRTAQSTVPSAATSIVAFGLTSRMSKMWKSPLNSGASSASIEKVSAVIAGSPFGPPPTATSEKVTDGNGSIFAVASP